MRNPLPIHLFVVNEWDSSSSIVHNMPAFFAFLTFPTNQTTFLFLFLSYYPMLINRGQDNHLLLQPFWLFHFSFLHFFFCNNPQICVLFYHSGNIYQWNFFFIISFFSLIIITVLFILFSGYFRSLGLWLYLPHLWHLPLNFLL